MLTRVAAFLRRDILIEASYKLSFTLNIFAVFSSVLVYYFIDRLFAGSLSAGGAMAAGLEEFGVGYFSYVLVGMAFFSFAGSGMGSLPLRLRQEQVQGTLESLILTPCPLGWLVLSFGASSLLMAALDFLIYAALGIFVFRLDFSRVNLVSSAAIFLLAGACFSSVGIMSASLIMRFKRGNLTGWLFNNVQAILGGVYFPVTVLPGWMQDIARLVPLTHALRAFERAVYTGASIYDLRVDILTLALFTIVLAPLGLWCFRASLRQASRDGTLSHY